MYGDVTGHGVTSSVRHCVVRVCVCGRCGASLVECGADLCVGDVSLSVCGVRLCVDGGV